VPLERLQVRAPRHFRRESQAEVETLGGHRAMRRADGVLVLGPEWPQT
jgi:hypothetical protein